DPSGPGVPRADVAAARVLAVAMEAPAVWPGPSNGLSGSKALRSPAAEATLPYSLCHGSLGLFRSCSRNKLMAREPRHAQGRLDLAGVFLGEPELQRVGYVTEAGEAGGSRTSAPGCAVSHRGRRRAQAASLMRRFRRLSASVHGHEQPEPAFNRLVSFL